MKAYDSNANASVEGGRTKERKGRESSESEREKEREREGRRLGSGRGKWCEREGGRSRDGEEHSSQLDGAGRLSMPRSAQARVRVLFLSVLVSLALFSLLVLPLFLSPAVSYARSAARIRKYKHLAGRCFRVYVSSLFR